MNYISVAPLSVNILDKPHQPIAGKHYTLLFTEAVLVLGFKTLNLSVIIG